MEKNVQSNMDTLDPCQGVYKDMYIYLYIYSYLHIGMYFYMYICHCSQGSWRLIFSGFLRCGAHR